MGRVNRSSAIILALLGCIAVATGEKTAPVGRWAAQLWDLHRHWRRPRAHKGFILPLIIY
jgi:hypothetical protein